MDKTNNKSVKTKSKNVNQEIVSKAKVLSENCAEQLGLKIISVEYVFESGIKILRVIAEGKDGLSLDEASDLNELISNKLDVEDFIDEEYYLEVSSEGIEKELKTDEDIYKAVGKYVFIKVYEKINGIKEFYGDLINFDGNVISLSYMAKNIKKNVEIQKNMISKIRLAVKF